ncbi:MAG: ribbon-helix-helix domain-containing protein [Patescibacteria group bacterium]
MATFSISLPDQIAQTVNMESKKLGFATRSEFIRDILRKYFSQETGFEVFKPVLLDEVKFQMAKTGKYSQKFIEGVTKGLSKSSVYAN